MLLVQASDILCPFLRAVALASDDELREGGCRRESLPESEIPCDEVGIEGGIGPGKDGDI